MQTGIEKFYAACYTLNVEVRVLYVYNYGAIGETVRAKINGYKEQFRGGKGIEASFGEVLRSYLDNTKPETRIVSATGNNSFSAEKTASDLNGSLLLYAMQTQESEDISSKVLSALGFGTGTSTSGLSASAENLSLSASQLMQLNNAEADTSVKAAEFVSDYNKLINSLSADGSSSAHLYKTALSAAYTAFSEELKKNGLTIENGLLSYSGTGRISDGFLNSVISTAEAAASYGASVTTDRDENGLSEYYTSIMNSMI